jgi:hypothetical protein
MWGLAMLAVRLNADCIYFFSLISFSKSAALVYCLIDRLSSRCMEPCKTLYRDLTRLVWTLLLRLHLLSWTTSVFPLLSGGGGGYLWPSAIPSVCPALAQIVIRDSSQ